VTGSTHWFDLYSSATFCALSRSSPSTFSFCEACCSVWRASVASSISGVTSTPWEPV
jgi:hypothetical protein